MTQQLAAAKCQNYVKGDAALGDQEVAILLAQIEGWSRDAAVISKTYHFSNYHETLAFVNATAWISHRQDHHPDLSVAYKHCRVAYTTHSVGGLSRNDFICAAKVDALFGL